MYCCCYVIQFFIIIVSLLCLDLFARSMNGNSSFTDSNGESEYVKRYKKKCNVERRKEKKIRIYIMRIIKQIKTYHLRLNYFFVSFLLA